MREGFREIVSAMMKILKPGAVWEQDNEPESARWALAELALWLLLMLLLGGLTAGALIAGGVL